MLRKKLIAGNWKMNGKLEDGVNLARAVSAAVRKLTKPQCEFLICPPFTLLYSVKKVLRGNKVALGAQDAHTASKGAHTGDISSEMLKDIGCSYVILGHSERRTNHGESSRVVARKAAAAHANGLKTIICIGETEKERDEGRTIEVCTKQIRNSMPAGSQAFNTVIAYEPVWAIGTGKTPTPQDVEEVHAAIRKAVAKKLNKTIASRMRILYGGSVKPTNASEFLSLPDVDGALIGGASLKVEDFMAIAKSVY